MHRYSFPESDQARIIIDLSEGNSDTSVETYINQINDTTIEGYRFSKGWAEDQREYFTLVSSKPISNFVVYDGNKKTYGKNAKGVYIKGFLEFKTSKNEEVIVKMGISPVSSENAFVFFSSYIEISAISSTIPRRFSPDISTDTNIDDDLAILNTDCLKERCGSTGFSCK